MTIRVGEWPWTWYNRGMSLPEFPILYEDDDILLINKPAGVVINTSSTYSERTVQDWMEEKLGLDKLSQDEKDAQMVVENAETADFYKYPEQIFLQRAGIVHRLDKQTSGVLLLAKNPTALVNLLQQFKQRKTQKTYLTLVHGKVTPEAGEINQPIGRNPKDRFKFAVRDDGRASTTTYQTREYYPHLDTELVVQQAKSAGIYEEYKQRLKKQLGQTTQFKKLTKTYQGFTLLEASPKTGRTHQIRVHLAHMNHPVVGDTVYAGKKRASLDPIWCQRQFLHASSLTFTHPITDQQITIEAPLPSDLETVLQFLSTVPSMN